jgi:hypothetical protein
MGQDTRALNKGLRALMKSQPVSRFLTCANGGHRPITLEELLALKARYDAEPK